MTTTTEFPAAIAQWETRANYEASQARLAHAGKGEASISNAFATDVYFFNLRHGRLQDQAAEILAELKSSGQ